MIVTADRLEPSRSLYEDDLIQEARRSVRELKDRMKELRGAQPKSGSPR
jgi:hypothetical protein